MCLAPITIYNNSDYINPDAWDVKRVVACGHCTQCQMTRQTEYAVRGYYEFQECLNDGGYVYWDTLTYSEQHLPYSFGCPCFRKKHIQDFIRAVRLDLKRHYNIENAFRYLCVSEYGDKGARPHYHIIFFVHNPNLDLDLLHKMILDHWRPLHGNTDFSCEPNGRVLTSQAAIYYVTKYLQKLDVRLDKFYERINEKIVECGHAPITRRTFNNHFANWQLHSLGFGSYLLACPDQQFLISNLCCSIPTKTNPNKVISLPSYYKRMRSHNSCVMGLYTVETIESPNGESRRVWRGTEKLLAYQIQNYKARFNSLLLSLNNKVRSLDKIYAEIKKDNSDIVRDVARFKDFRDGDKSTLSDYVYSLVGSRDLSSLASYVIDRRYRVDVESQSTEDIILHRILDPGNTINPIKYPRFAYVEDPKDYYSSMCEPVYEFDMALDLIATVYKYFSDALTLSDTNERLQKLELKNGVPLAYKQLY